MAAVLNAHFDSWRQEVLIGVERPTLPIHGTLNWLFREYLQSDDFQERVSQRSRPDYKNLFEQIARLEPLKGPYKNVGELPVHSITALAARKLYARLCEGGKYRRGEKAVAYCKTAWTMMRSLYPHYFRTDVPNPWVHLTLKRRRKFVKAAVDRATVYQFAWATVEKHPELAAAAVICFEWLQRPENVIGHMTWNDYRGAAAPHEIRVVHYKTNKVVMHPLSDDNGEPLYPDAEVVLAKLPKRAVLMVVGPKCQRYKPTRIAQLVRRAADDAGLPKTFTLDACRHGGINELEEAGLTEGQAMLLTGHSSPRAYWGYAKQSRERELAATRRRIAGRNAKLASVSTDQTNF